MNEPTEDSALPPPSGPRLATLETLLGQHAVAALATAIERHGVWFFDQFGRLVQDVGDVDDPYRSKPKALELLAARYAEQQDPGPVNSWDAECWETETHPLGTYGWPTDAIPSFDGADATNAAPLTRALPEEVNEIESDGSRPEWIPKAQMEARIFLEAQRAKGNPHTKKAVAKEVEHRLSRANVRGRGDKAITAANIERCAFDRVWWERANR